MRWLLFVLLEFDGKATRKGVEKIVFRLQIFGHRSGNHAAVERKKGEEGIWQSLTVFHVRGFSFEPPPRSIYVDPFIIRIL